LIVFGDSVGGFLYFLIMLFEVIFHIAPLILSGKHLSLSLSQQEKVIFKLLKILQYVGLLGISLILIRSAV